MLNTHCRFTLLAAAFVFSFVHTLIACTNILISKGASVDGTVSITYTADSAGFYPQLAIFPAQDHPDGTFITIPKTKHHDEILIPQTAHTYQVIGVVWEQGLLHIDHFPRQGCINEHQLAIAETTFGGHEELVNPKAVINYPMLITFALQRAKTAREAIDVMVELVDKYGYCDEGESISIADKNEAWVFEIVGVGMQDVAKGNNAVWAARKVPDGEISVHANQSRIGELPDKPDKNSFFYSSNVRSFAVERKLYDPASGKPFRFDDAYGNIDAKSKRVCEARVWSVFRRAAPSQTFDPAYHRGDPNAKPYSWSIKPDKKLSTADIMALMRDNYEGTDYDMTKGIDAGNYGTPRRWRPLYWTIEDENAADKNSSADGDEYAWERPISTQQTGFSIVTQSRSTLPDEVGGVLWYGVDDSYLSCYFPLYCCISELPKSYTVGSIKEFSWDSAWWVFNLVSNYANLKYSVISPEIIAVQKEFETKFFTLQTPVEQTATEILKTNPDLAKRYLTDYSVSQAETVAARWKKLATEIFTKHNDGYYVTEDGSRPNEKSAYPQDWLKRVLKEKPEAFKLPKEPTRNQIGYFEQPLVKLLERSMGTDKVDKNKIEDFVDEIKLHKPNLFFAEASLIDSFKTKTFDKDKCKSKIREAIKALPETKQTELQKILVKQFEKDDCEGNELEIIRRVLE